MNWPLPPSNILNIVNSTESTVLYQLNFNFFCYFILNGTTKTNPVQTGLIPIRQGGYVFSVDSRQDYTKTTPQIFIKLGGKVYQGPRKDPID